uniref:Uncharacterized protein n=1 Tax=Opuntia streptacantha TaxID=393608 RepID=A0A7C9CLF4_OPUST
MQRHFTNFFMDTYKQKAINIFLGHIQPEVDGAYQFRTIVDKSLLKRSQSDSKIYYETSSDEGDLLSSPEISSTESDPSNSRSSSEGDLSNSRHPPYTSTARLIFYLERHWFGGGDKRGPHI